MQEHDYLLSSFVTTPSVLDGKLHFTSSRKISDNLLSKCVFKDFLGTTPNPGYLPNSIIYTGSITKNNQLITAYSNADPRITSKDKDMNNYENSASLLLLNNIQLKCPDNRYQRIFSNRNKSQRK